MLHVLKSEIFIWGGGGGGGGIGWGTRSPLSEFSGSAPGNPPQGIFVDTVSSFSANVTERVLFHGEPQT